MKTIQLTRGKVALVDDEDFEWLNQWKWCASQTRTKVYAMRVEIIKGVRHRIVMHRLLRNLQTNLEVDHINGDSLDNRRNNLRSCLHLHNVRNASKRENSGSPYKGVYHKIRAVKNPWRAWIRMEGTRHHLGYFPDPISAAVAYDMSAIILFGEYAKLNFPGCYA